MPGHGRSSSRREQDIEGPIAAIRDGKLDRVSAGVANSQGEGSRCRPGAERSLERVRRADRDGLCAQGAVSAAAQAAHVP